MLLAISPIRLILSDDDNFEHILSIGISMLETNATNDIRSIPIFDDQTSVLKLIILGLFLLLVFFIGVVVSYETSHYIIRPLRELNNKMREIL